MYRSSYSQQQIHEGIKNLELNKIKWEINNRREINLSRISFISIIIYFFLFEFKTIRTLLKIPLKTENKINDPPKFVQLKHAQQLSLGDRENLQVLDASLLSRIVA